MHNNSKQVLRSNLSNFFEKKKKSLLSLLCAIIDAPSDFKPVPVIPVFWW